MFHDLGMRNIQIYLFWVAESKSDVRFLASRLDFDKNQKSYISDSNVTLTLFQTN